jgi:hypothetical protein
MIVFLVFIVCNFLLLKKPIADPLIYFTRNIGTMFLFKNSEVF